MADRPDLSLLRRPRGGWRCLIADPPWRFDNTRTRAAAERHYPTLSPGEIACLPVGELAARDAVLALWVPDTFLLQALVAARAWGFAYRHLVVWGKVGASGRIQVGLGNYCRKAHEVALLCTRGRPERLDRGVPSLILRPRGQHSSKPVVLHDMLERYCVGPRLELFGRAARAGWTVWGAEAPASPPPRGSPP